MILLEVKSEDEKKYHYLCSLFQFVAIWWFLNVKNVLDNGHGFVRSNGILFLFPMFKKLYSSTSLIFVLLFFFLFSFIDCIQKHITILSSNRTFHPIYTERFYDQTIDHVAHMIIISSKTHERQNRNIYSILLFSEWEGTVLFIRSSIQRI